MSAQEVGAWQVDPLEIQFIKEIRAARIRLGISQRTAAARMRELGYTYMRQQMITKMETGSRSVRLGEAVALAQMMGVTVPGLLGGEVEAWGIQDAAQALESAAQDLSTQAQRLRRGAGPLPGPQRRGGHRRNTRTA